MHSGVGLHADEVVSFGGPEERVLENVLRHVPGELPSLVGHDLRHRQGEADRISARSRPECLHGQPVGTHHGLVDRQVPSQVVLHPRWVVADGVTHGPDDVGLVDGAGPTDQVAQMGSGPLHEAGEPFGGVGGFEAAPSWPATREW